MIQGRRFFICPGAQKSGTTTLHDLLCKHPQIALPENKETKYFISTSEVRMDEYLNKYYSGVQNKEILGEIDPDYMFEPTVPKKLFSLFGGDLKLIFMLRNPVDRAYSNYWMSYRRGFESESFERSFELEAERLASKDSRSFWHRSYFVRGFYSQQIDNFLQYFNKDNCLFITFDEFVGKRENTLKKILQFLGVDDTYDFPDVDIKSNEAGLPRFKMISWLFGQQSPVIRLFKVLIPSRNFRWKVIYPLIEKLNISSRKPPEMRPETRAKLIQYYSEEVKMLQSSANIDLEAWREL